MLLDQRLKLGPCGVGCAPARGKEAPRSVVRGQGGSCLIFSPFPQHITAASLGNTSSWESRVFLPSLHPTPHPMPGLTAGLGHRGLTGRTQAAGDSIYSLWSWGREKKKGKGWALSVFYPLPPIARGFVPWEGPGSTRHSVLEGAERCRETAGRAGLQGEEQKRPVSLVYVG